MNVYLTEDDLCVKLNSCKYIHCKTGRHLGKHKKLSIFWGVGVE
jgi:hypothetical protein